MSDERASKSTRIDSLVDELMLEIFYRLPCTELVMQCKCVCKSWYNLISKSPDDFTSHFIAKKGRTDDDDIQVPYTLYVYRKGKTTGIYPKGRGFDCAFKSRKYSLKFLPCHGKAPDLPVYLRGWHGDLVVYTNSSDKELEYYVCNPRTKQWLLLPPPTRRKHPCLAAFTCDPYYMFDGGRRCGSLLLNLSCRFTVCHVYKLVPGGAYDNLEMEIYSSETRVWRRHATLVWTKPVTILYTTRFYSFTYNGMLHCYCKAGIIGFDQYKIGEDGVIHVHYIQMPPYDEVRRCRRSVAVGVFRGKIRLVECASHDISSDQKGLVNKRGFLNISEMRVEPQDPPSSLKIWELDNYKTSEWSLKNEVFLHELYSEDFALTQHIRKGCPVSQVFHCQPNDANVLFALPKYIISDGTTGQPRCRASQIVECNLREKTLKTIWNVPEICQVYGIAHPLWPTPLPSHT